MNRERPKFVYRHRCSSCWLLIDNTTIILLSPVLHRNQRATLPIMKLTSIAFFASVLVTAQAFSAPPAFVRNALATQLFSEPNSEEEEGGLDLDLGEMFEMFEAAAKEEKFDDAIKKVKKGDN